MTVDDIQTYVVLAEETSVYQAPQNGSPVGGVRLMRGQVFSGKPAENGTVWIATGIGFVPGDKIATASRYEATGDVFVRTAADPNATVAEDGKAMLRRGQQFEAAAYAPGWLWVIDGRGFVPDNTTRSVGMARPTYP